MKDNMTITNDNGDSFTVVILRKGDTYGLDFCLTHDEDRLVVEFYDTEHRHTRFGQFISRYNMDTLLEGSSRQHGLDLMGYVAKWKIDANTMQIVNFWLRHQAENGS